MKKRFFAILGALVLAAPSWGQPVYVELDGLFGRDVVLEPGGTGLTGPLDEEDGYVDGATLPDGYANGSPYATQDGRASFLFAPLGESALDAFAVDGQTLDVPDGKYASADFAFLAAPGSFTDPFGEIEFRYADGSATTSRLGPLAGWFASPSAFENTAFSFTDESDVETIVEFDTFGDDEPIYLFQEQGNGNAGGTRFVDGTGFALYLFEVDPGLTEAKLGVNVGNNFVISIATEYFPPEISTEEGYTVVANSMELYDGFEHRALGNLQLYEFDLAPFLAEGTGEIFVLFTDATPSNGWGPYIQDLSIFTGEVRRFEETIAPPVETNGAAIHAAFQTDGGEDEMPHLYDNSGSGPSSRGHRFADGNGSLTYRFDLPDDTTEAAVTMDIANNFVVSLSGASNVTRYAQMTPGTPEEFNLLIDEGGSILGGNFRFADASAYMVYQFDLPDDISEAYAHVNVGNQFIIEAAGPEGDFNIEMDWVGDTGEQTTDNSNLDTYVIDLSPYLEGNAENIVRIRLSDGVPADGWGPYLTGINILNTEETSSGAFTEVLNSMEMFGVDVRNEFNKGYYTVDVTPYLENNPTKEVFVRLTDGSTGDGWGPGVFWMAAHTGEIVVQGDRKVFEGLKATSGEPLDYGLGLNHRRVGLEASKVLTEIAFPAASAAEEDTAHIMAVTLNPGETAVGQWMLH